MALSIRCALVALAAACFGTIYLASTKSIPVHKHAFLSSNSGHILTAPSLKRKYQEIRSPLQMSFKLTFGDDRVALVTGAGRGIGKKIAETLAKGGVGKVLCVSKSPTSCGAVAEGLRNEGYEAYAHPVDVSDSVAVSALCSEIVSKYGAVDILVNNAGITKDKLMLAMKASDWEDVINTNLNSAFYFISPIVRRMIRKKFGRIINMASVVGISGNAGQANYAAAKAGLIGLTKSLAREVASRGITVNAIAPGFIKSDMTDKMPEHAKTQTLTTIPAGRLGTLEEVANLAAFLASDQADYINGKVIAIDGAML
ncbi:3-ketoacyl-(acyl-carrier-protein) reductase [Cardiosporidium cionae]|uniref:3-oxoacyl-[acyl-carrier-protein] reductase n=1 Tax=Cardiosporidium cionae TaxID=476202 RepID=A0A3Q8UBF1_9APIC|nr:hydroxysteroid 17-beta dehydrogenase 4 [Cardiosporidium cionae]KAF8820797.1 3-ketoacyl-(acyl-carrier-protein) reductase [Cardiosporidium cionae]|eukprot:KAF8820797.1 3-ketoacyl-(acyl-carrier-protein) reductase [Cardiosporidium cionae]